MKRSRKPEPNQDPWNIGQEADRLEQRLRYAIEDTFHWSSQDLDILTTAALDVANLDYAIQTQMQVWFSWHA